MTPLHRIALLWLALLNPAFGSVYSPSAEEGVDDDDDGDDDDEDDDDEDDDDEDEEDEDEED